MIFKPVKIPNQHGTPGKMLREDWAKNHATVQVMDPEYKKHSYVHLRPFEPYSDTLCKLGRETFDMTPSDSLTYDVCGKCLTVALNGKK